MNPESPWPPRAARAHAHLTRTLPRSVAAPTPAAADAPKADAPEVPVAPILSATCSASSKRLQRQISATLELGKHRTPGARELAKNAVVLAASSSAALGLGIATGVMAQRSPEAFTHAGQAGAFGALAAGMVAFGSAVASAVENERVLRELGSELLDALRTPSASLLHTIREQGDVPLGELLGTVATKARRKLGAATLEGGLNGTLGVVGALLGASAFAPKALPELAITSAIATAVGLATTGLAWGVQRRRFASKLESAAGREDVENAVTLVAAARRAVSVEGEEASQRTHTLDMAAQAADASAVAGYVASGVRNAAMAVRPFSFLLTTPIFLARSGIVAAANHRERRAKLQAPAAAARLRERPRIEHRPFGILPSPWSRFVEKHAEAIETQLGKAPHPQATKARLEEPENAAVRSDVEECCIAEAHQQRFQRHAEKAGTTTEALLEDRGAMRDALESIVTSDLADTARNQVWYDGLTLSVQAGGLVGGFALVFPGALWPLAGAAIGVGGVGALGTLAWGLREGGIFRAKLGAAFQGRGDSSPAGETKALTEKRALDTFLSHLSSYLIAPTTPGNRDVESALPPIPTPAEARRLRRSPSASGCGA